MISNLLSFTIVLGILVLFHEFGHFLVARLFHVGVEKFSVGFGPKIIGKKIGITEYRLSAIPLGGYVKMVGESPDKDIPEKDIPLSFTHKHVFKKMAIVAAGPVFNILLAVFIFWGIYLFSGMPILDAAVGKVEPGSPAFSAGIEPRDKIAAIDGEVIESWDQMADKISTSGGKELEMTVLREKRELILRISPKRSQAPGEKTERYLIGVSLLGSFHKKKMGPIEALWAGTTHSAHIVRLTVMTVANLIRGAVSAKTLGGPIQIARMAGDQAREGILNLIVFIAWLSVNLAVLNLLPIPVLDGGHFVFFLAEAISGHPVSPKIQERAQQVGVMALFALMAFVFYNDIARLFLE
jgi:regulator of sigma E protease